jgi:hypothetical protein
MTRPVVADGRDNESGYLGCGILFDVDRDTRRIGECWPRSRSSRLRTIMPGEKFVQAPDRNVFKKIRKRGKSRITRSFIVEQSTAEK